jgi:hypothetical protein
MLASNLAHAQKTQPSPSPSSEPQYEVSLFGDFFSRWQHLSPSQRAQLRDVFVQAHRERDAILAKKKTLSLRESADILTRARADARKFLTPKQFEAFFKYAGLILFYEEAKNDPMVKSLLGDLPEEIKKDLRQP